MCAFKSRSFRYLLVMILMVVLDISSTNIEHKEDANQKQLKKYLSPDMVEELQKDPSKLKLGGERREMTFMFMDICGFTPISEAYKNRDDPEGLVELINKFLDVQTKIIINNRGTIDKYMGDCIMAFWNAPLDCENVNLRKSALEVLDPKKLNEELAPFYLLMSIGISKENVLSKHGVRT